ncbi:MAG: response regulator transcription factor [Flavobacteriales bacterium]|nr:response regulator transcription factor [Flavobacteriales bacterium]MCB9446855.1 response regulator transcription factor [Flavobacteriales bacterium]
MGTGIRNKILLVDDDPDIRTFLGYNLRKEGFVVAEAASGVEALKAARSTKPDLVILDIMMPEMDGVETCVQLRAIDELEQPIIIFLTARNEDYSQIAALDAGGDDYVTKPIKPRVLISRIQALLRRVHQPVHTNGHTIHEGEEPVLNADRYTVQHAGEEYNLPKKEFELLSLLMSKPGKVFTRGFIMSQIWGEEVFISDRTIDVHIRKLRKKVGKDKIRTIKGIGYTFGK